MTVTADALDLLAGDPPRTRTPNDFHRHPTTGAPYVTHPTDTNKDGSPRRVMYGRPSSFGAALDNPYNLVKWKERQLLNGMVRPEIIDLIETNGYPDPDDRDGLDQLAARCHDAAGSHLAADQGTHIHKLCEYADRGDLYADLYPAGEALGIPLALQRQIVHQWQAFRYRLGVTAVGIEQTVVNDRWRLAGTLDRLDIPDHDIPTAYGILAAGEAFIGDVKTGSLSLGNDGQPSFWTKYSVQIAAYVDSMPYDTETDTRSNWLVGGDDHSPNPDIALIYHYDLARALNGEPVDWRAIPVNVQAGREGGDMCRQAADFGRRRDLFAMPAATVIEPEFYTDEIGVDDSIGVAAGVDAVGRGVDTKERRVDAPLDAGREGHAKSREDRPPHVAAPTTCPPCQSGTGGRYVREKGQLDRFETCPECPKIAAPGPFGGERQAAEPEPPVPAQDAARSSAANPDRLRARIGELIAAGHEDLVRQSWPADIPPLSRPGHTAEQLERLLLAVRRVEAEVGAPWHPDDGATAEDALVAKIDSDPDYYLEPGNKVQRLPVVHATPDQIDALNAAFNQLDPDGRALCGQIASEAHAAGRSISVSADPTVRRWSIARAVIAWAASGRSVDELWMSASMLATFDQCADASATLGGLISQFTIAQADRLYAAVEVVG